MKQILILSLMLALAACAQGPNSASRPVSDTPSAPEGTASKPKITALQLLGKDDAWVLNNMGEPAFRRADRVANIWQYKNATCVLNVFLYADDTAASSAKRVLHFDARDSSGNNTDRDACLSGLQHD